MYQIDFDCNKLAINRLSSVTINNFGYFYSDGLLDSFFKRLHSSLTTVYHDEISKFYTFFKKVSYDIYYINDLGGSVRDEQYYSNRTETMRDDGSTIKDINISTDVYLTKLYGQLSSFNSVYGSFYDCFYEELLHEINKIADEKSLSFYEFIKNNQISNIVSSLISSDTSCQISDDFPQYYDQVFIDSVLSNDNKQISATLRNLSVDTEYIQLPLSIILTPVAENECLIDVINEKISPIIREKLTHDYDSGLYPKISSSTIEALKELVVNMFNVYMTFRMQDVFDNTSIIRNAIKDVDEIIGDEITLNKCIKNVNDDELESYYKAVLRTNKNILGLFPKIFNLNNIHLKNKDSDDLYNFFKRSSFLIENFVLGPFNVDSIFIQDLVIEYLSLPRFYDVQYKYQQNFIPLNKNTIEHYYKTTEININFEREKIKDNNIFEYECQFDDICHNVYCKNDIDFIKENIYSLKSLDNFKQFLFRRSKDDEYEIIQKIINEKTTQIQNDVTLYKETIIELSSFQFEDIISCLLYNSTNDIIHNIKDLESITIIDDENQLSNIIYQQLYNKVDKTIKDDMDISLSNIYHLKEIFNDKNNLITLSEKAFGTHLFSITSMNQGNRYEKPLIVILTNGLFVYTVTTQIREILKDKIREMYDIEDSWWSWNDELFSNDKFDFIEIDKPSHSAFSVIMSLANAYKHVFVVQLSHGNFEMAVIADNHIPYYSHYMIERVRHIRNLVWISGSCYSGSLFSCANTQFYKYAAEYTPFYGDIKNLSDNGSDMLFCSASSALAPAFDVKFIFMFLMIKKDLIYKNWMNTWNELLRTIREQIITFGKDIFTNQVSYIFEDQSSDVLTVGFESINTKICRLVQLMEYFFCGYYSNHNIPSDEDNFLCILRPNRMFNGLIELFRVMDIFNYIFEHRYDYDENNCGDLISLRRWLKINRFINFNRINTYNSVFNINNKLYEEKHNIPYNVFDWLSFFQQKCESKTVKISDVFKVYVDNESFQDTYELNIIKFLLKTSKMIDEKLKLYISEDYYQILNNYQLNILVSPWYKNSDVICLFLYEILMMCPAFKQIRNFDSQLLDNKIFQ